MATFTQLATFNSRNSSMYQGAALPFHPRGVSEPRVGRTGPRLSSGRLRPSPALCGARAGPGGSADCRRFFERKGEPAHPNCFACGPTLASTIGDGRLRGVRCSQPRAVGALGVQVNSLLLCAEAWSWHTCACRWWEKHLRIRQTSVLRRPINVFGAVPLPATSFHGPTFLTVFWHDS